MWWHVRKHICKTDEMGSLRLGSVKTTWQQRMPEAGSASSKDAEQLPRDWRESAVIPRRQGAYNPESGWNSAARHSKAETGVSKTWSCVLRTMAEHKSKCAVTNTRGLCKLGSSCRPREGWYNMERIFARQRVSSNTAHLDNVHYQYYC